jgi:type IV pilus assembly protein PilM
MPLDQAVLEHIPLGVVETPEGPRARVVLVAARRDMLERFLGAARQAGLRPEGIDLSAFAMIRALGRSESGVATVFVSVGGLTNLAIAEGTRCLFTRVMTGGYETLAGELAERRGLTLEHAGQWLSHVGLVEPLDLVEGDPEIVSEARAILSEGARRIGDAIRNSLDFYRTQDGTISVESAVLTGPACTVPGFAEQLASELGMPVRNGVPLEGRAGAFGGTDGGRLAIAAGLTVEEAVA